MFEKRRLGVSDKSGLIGALLVIALLLIMVVASMLILIFLGTVVFAVSLGLGIVLVVGLLIVWFAPPAIKLVGLLMIAIALIVAILKVLL